MKVIDISQPVGLATAVWPGDKAVETGWTMRRDAGDSVNVAHAHFTVHAGTHVDGPRHVFDEGPFPADLPIEAFLGRALVIDARGRDTIGVDVLAGLSQKELNRAERFLFRTRDTIDATTFPASFAAVSPDLARRLVELGALLIGTDAPSVDPVDSKTLDAHRVLLQGGVAIIENLVLSDVAPGRYTLIALPLKLTDTDSAPARAVLIEGNLNE